MKFKDKYVIGITGGIGAGKTTVLNYIKDEYNALIIEADKLGHKFMEPNTLGYKKIVEIFGDAILHDSLTSSDKVIDRKKLGDIVFLSKDELKKLNAIIHPLVHNDIMTTIISVPNDTIVVEAAILTETSLKELCDEIWYIYADMETRIKRLEINRGMSRQKALAVMENQPDDDTFREKCDVIINNSNSADDTFSQIRKYFRGGKR